MRLIFMGTPRFALPSLEKLVHGGHNILAVVTRPDQPQGRGLKEAPPPVKLLAEEMDLPVMQPESLRDPAFIQQLIGYRADLFVVVAFRILPGEVFTIPPMGTIDLHPSLLPQYRGAAPIQWAIINGESQTGVSVFFIGEKIDAGDIIVQSTVPIGPDETAGQLSERLARAGADALLEAVNAIADGHAVIRVQPGLVPSSAPKITRQDGRIRWTRSASQVRNLIRGLNPKPGAFTTFGGKTIKIYRADLAGPSAESGEPGQVMAADAREGLLVNTADGQLFLREVQLEGKKRMTVEEFIRGFRLQEGDRFD
jgi:methionyl-tRNA formyltransferase